MKTITKEFKVYEYQELSEKTQENVFNEWYKCQEYFYHSEQLEALENCLEMFNLKLKGYSIDLNNRNFFKINLGQVEKNILELKGNRLLKYVYNHIDFKGKYLKSIEKDLSKYFKFKREVKFYKHSNKTVTYFYSKINLEYKSTGMCFDYTFEQSIKNLMETIRKDKNYCFEDYIKDTVSEFQSAYANDLEYQFSKECFEETFVTENEFLENGEIFYKDTQK